MSQTLHPNDAEKKVFRLAALDDGIWEIYLGGFFALMSFFPLTRSALGPAWNAVLALVVILLLVGGAWLLKQRLILPRTGVVKFGHETRKKIGNTRLLIGGLVIITLVVWLASAQGWLSWLQGFGPDLFFALLIFALFAAIAYLMELPRFYLHGLLLGAGNFAGAVLQGEKFTWPLALAGGLIALIGAFVLTQFLQQHPQPAEADHAG